MIKNYYQILGIEPNATSSEIKKAYRLYATKFHPDKQSGDKFFEERFKEINEAYEVLIDDSRRREYDNHVLKNEGNYRNKDNSSNQKPTNSNLYQQQSYYEKEVAEKLKQERLKREHDLGNKIYFKDDQLEISGLIVKLRSNKKLKIYNYHKAKTQRIINEENKVRPMLYTAYSLLILGIATLIFYIGILLILVGLVYLIIAIKRGAFKVFKKITSYDEYRIELIGNEFEDEFIIKGNRKKAKQIVSAINYSIKNYYSP